MRIVTFKTQDRRCLVIFLFVSWKNEDVQLKCTSFENEVPVKLYYISLYSYIKDLPANINNLHYYNVQWS